MNNLSLIIPVVTAVLTALTTIGTMYFKDIFFQKKKDSINYIKEKLEKCYTPLYLKLKLHEQMPLVFDETPSNFVREELHEIILKNGHYLSFELMNDYVKLVDFEASDEAGKALYKDNGLYLDEHDKRDKIGIRQHRTFAYRHQVREFAIKIEKEYEEYINYIQRAHSHNETSIVQKMGVLETIKDFVGYTIR